MLFFRPTLFIGILVLLLGPVSVLGASSEVGLIKDNILTWLIPKLFSLDESNPCYKDLSQVAWGIIHLEQWALSMLDAVGKPEANLLGVNIGWAGSYEECVEIKKGPIKGQHCWLTIKVEKNASKESSENGFQLIGICVPKSCKNRDFDPIANSMKALVNKASSMLPFNASLAPSIDCEYSHIHYTMTSFIAIGIGCILLLFTLLGTSVDILTRPTREKNGLINGKKVEIKIRRKKFCAVFNRFVLLFSWYSNGRKLFASEKAGSEATTFGQLNAMKVMAMVQVIFLHVFRFLSPITKNPKKLGEQYGSWFLQPFLQEYSVDTFFLITGFLTLHGVLRKPPLQAKTRYIFTYILRRYFKLMLAPLIIVLVTQVAIKPHLSSSPFWHAVDGSCSDFWWRKIFFFSNFQSFEDNECFFIWWFLSATVQLHLLSLIVIVPLINKRYSWSVWGGSALLLGSWSCLAWKAHRSILFPLYHEGSDYGEWLAFLEGHKLFFYDLYPTPYYHLGPYVVGMGLAWFLFKYSAGFSLTTKRVCVGWALSSLGLYLVNFGVYMKPNRMLRMVHMIFGTTVYGLSLAWIVYICNTKINGLVSRMLRWKWWLPLSKLNLSAYLVHWLVVEYLCLSENEKVLYSAPLLVSKFVTSWVATYPLAIVATLSIEMPLGAIVDAIFT